jgi:hypothetical protein
MSLPDIWDYEVHRDEVQLRVEIRRDLSKLKEEIALNVWAGGIWRIIRVFKLLKYHIKLLKPFTMKLLLLKSKLILIMQCLLRKQKLTNEPHGSASLRSPQSLSHTRVSEHFIKKYIHKSHPIVRVLIQTNAVPLAGHILFL